MRDTARSERGSAESCPEPPQRDQILRADGAEVAAFLANIVPAATSQRAPSIGMLHALYAGMLKIGSIKPHMPVVCSEGGQFAVVDHLSSDNRTLKLAKDKNGNHHYIPVSWITSIDDAVHIDRPGDQAMREWSSEAA